MKIQWHPDLATGHHEIDADHKEIFDKINELIVACKEKKEKPVVTELLRYLNRYVHSHFVLEESYLLQQGALNIQEHIRQHDCLRKNLDEITSESMLSGVNLSVVAKTLKLTYLWLKDHIQKMDKEII